MDVSAFQKQNENIATKDDIAKVDATLKNLFTRIKHMSILQAELARSNVPHNASSSFKATENVNTKILKRDFLAKQAQITAQWVADTPLEKPVATQKN